jgi:putative ABC transport system permease protein
MDRYGAEWTTVVGIVGDVRHQALEAEPQPEYYVHYLQRPDRAQYASLIIESSVEPSSLIGPVSAALRQLDPDVPAEFTTMESRLSSSVADRRFTMLVLSLFAVLALTLAAVGIYGVVSYSVAQRTREIGIRMALGAEPASLLAMTLRRSLAVVLAGMLIGGIGAYALTRVMRNLLFEVSPTDPLTLAAVVAVLTAIAGLATYVPARRGTRVDPLITMRSE